MNIRDFFHTNFLFSFFLLYSSAILSIEHSASIDNTRKTVISLNTKNIYEDIKIGFYSGTFDPPTKAHNVIIRNAIENLRLDRLYIFVNKSSEKITKCSSKERVMMLKRMLKDIEDRVIIIAQSSDSKRDDYLMIKNILIKEKVIHIVGEDSYQRRLLIIPENRIQFDAIAIIPRIADGKESSKIEILESNAFYLPINDASMLNVSSTEVRAKLANRNYKDINLDGDVLSYIIENNLYTPKNSDLRKDIFAKEYYAYIGQLFCAGKIAAPCPLPPYDLYASESSWTEMFYKWIFNKNKRA